MNNLTSLKESGLNIFYVMLVALLSAGTPAFASESSEVWAYSAPPATETAVIAGPTHACVNSILTFRGNGNENNQHCAPIKIAVTTATRIGYQHYPQ